MKNFLTKILCIFAFILCFAQNFCTAADLDINSITFDDSATFLSINSYDNEEYNFSVTPKLYVISDENKAYFDITSAILSCPPQDIVLTTPDINEIIVKQFSQNPNVVRVVIKYNEGFNPKNIQLKRIENTLLVRFKTTQIQNYYFQHVYTDILSTVNSLYESIVIKTPVLATQNMISQINSAFKLGATTEDKNYILAKKDLVLPTKYYLDDISIKNGVIYLSGVGAYTLSKPFTLTNPSRVVYDIPNTFINQGLRNKEIYISQNESIKAGQFDTKTARLVITTPNVDKYIPVISPDNQKLAFINKSSQSSPYTSAKTTLTSISDELADTNTHFVKLIFSKPVTYSIERDSSSLNILFYNTEQAQTINIKNSFLFEGASITPLKSGNGIKLSIPVIKEDTCDIHVGVDAKTMRLKINFAKLELPKITPPPQPETTEIIPPKLYHKGKIYVVIDPGHGGSDCGATRNNIFEKDITLDISNRVEKLLSKKGYEVFMTRTSDETVSLEERVEISENVQPDIFVSIHVNSSNSSTPNGLETHYYKDNSLVLAKTVHASLLNHVNAANRGLFKSKFYVINHTTAPAILVEIGFISNDAERGQLVTESRKQATAKAIAEGIDAYFKK